YSVMIYAVSTVRADNRFTATPVRRFFKWRRSLRGLEHSLEIRNALRLREGIVALKIARVHFARGDLSMAARFLQIARVAPKSSRDALRCLRYQLRVAIRRGLQTLET